MAWASWEIPIGHAVNSFSFRLRGAFAPAIAAFIVRKWITHEGFSDAGLRPNLRKWPYYIVGWFLPLIVVGCIVIVAPVVGVGKPDFSLVRVMKYLVSNGVPVGLSRPWTVICGLVISAIFSAPINFGEEFGWRGYLQPRLFPSRPVLGAVATGIIWAYWHLPLSLGGGYFFPDHPLMGAIVIYPVSAIFISIIFGWLVLKTRSIWSSSLAHAATNRIGATLVVLLFGGGAGAEAIFVSYAGILAWIPLGALSLWIVLTGQLKPEKHKTLR